MHFFLWKICIHTYLLHFHIIEKKFKKYIECAIVITAQVFRSRFLAKTILIPAHSSIFQFAVLSQQLCTHAVCFNLCNSVHLVTSSFVLWKMAHALFRLNCILPLSRKRDNYILRDTHKHISSHTSFCKMKAHSFSRFSSLTASINLTSGI